MQKQQKNITEYLDKKSDDLNEIKVFLGDLKKQLTDKKIKKLEIDNKIEKLDKIKNGEITDQKELMEISEELKQLRIGLSDLIKNKNIELTELQSNKFLSLQTIINDFSLELDSYKISLLQDLNQKGEDFLGEKGWKGTKIGVAILSGFGVLNWINKLRKKKKKKKKEGFFKRTWHWLFGEKNDDVDKNDDNSDDNSDKKKKKGGFFKKLLIGAGIIGTGASIIYGSKNPEKIKKFFKGIGGYFTSNGGFLKGIRAGITDLFGGGKKERIKKAKELAKNDDTVKYDEDNDVFVYKKQEINARKIVKSDDPKGELQQQKNKIDEKLDKNPSDVNTWDTIDYLKKNPDQLKKYENIGDNVNQYFDNKHHTKFADNLSDEEKKYYGNLINGGEFLLGTTDYETIDDVKSTGLMVAQLDFICGDKINNLYNNDFLKKMLQIFDSDSLINFIKGLKREGTIWMINMLKGIIPDFPVIDIKNGNISSAHKKLEKWIKDNDNVLDYIKNSGKQFLKIQVYIEKTKEKFEFLLTQRKLKENFSQERDSKTDEEKYKRTIEKLADDNFYNKYIKDGIENNFLNKNILDAFDNIETKYPDIFDNINNSPLDGNEKKYIDAMMEEKSTYINDLIQYKKGEISDNDIDKKLKNEKILKALKDMYKSMEKLSYETWYNLFSQQFGFNGNAEEKKKLMASTGYDDYLHNYTKYINDWIDKMENDKTLLPNSDDYDKMIQNTDNFYNTMSDIELGTNLIIDVEEGYDPVDPEKKKKTLWMRIKVPFKKGGDIAKQSYHTVVMKWQDGKKGEALGAGIIGYTIFDFTTGGYGNLAIEKIFMKEGKWTTENFYKLSPSRITRKLVWKQIKLRSGDKFKNWYASRKRWPFNSANFFKGNVDEVFTKIGTGEISLERAKDILTKNKEFGTLTADTKTILIKRLSLANIDETSNLAKYIDKYGEDIFRKGLLEIEKTDATNMNKLKREKVTFKVNDDVVKTIDKFMKHGFENEGNMESFFEGLLQNTNDINSWKKTKIFVDNYLGNGKDELKTLFLKIGGNGKDKIFFGKMGANIGKYMNNFDNIKDIEKFFNVINNNAKSVKNMENFIANVLIDRKNIDYYIDNKGKFILEEKIIDKFDSTKPKKLEFKKYTAKVNKQIKNIEAKIPFSNKKAELKKQLSYAKELMEVDFKTFRALSFGPSSWMQNISEDGLKQMKQFSQLITNQGSDFLKRIKTAKNIDEIKDIFATDAGLNVNEVELPDEFCKKMSTMKSQEAILDMSEFVLEVKNVAEINKTANGVKKLSNTIKLIAKSPGLKFVFRNVMRIFVVAGFVFSGIEVINMFGDAKEISKTNQERADNMLKNAYTTGGLYALSAGLMFIPGVGWIGSAAIIAGTLITDTAKKVYFDKRNDALKNYRDFQTYQSDLLLKEHIISSLAYHYNTNRSIGDKTTNILNTISISIGKTSVDAIDKNMKFDMEKLDSSSKALKSLLYFDEIKNHPFGWILFLDTNNSDLMTKLEKDPYITHILKITGAKNIEQFIGLITGEIRERTNKRYNYILTKTNGSSEVKKNINLGKIETDDINNKIKNNEILDFSKLISKENLENNKAIEILDKTIIESKLATMKDIDGSDLNLNTAEKIKKYKKNILDKLDTSSEKYKKLELFFQNNKNQLLYYFQNTTIEEELYETNDSKKDIIKENLEYLKLFMSYKQINGEINVNQKIDLSNNNTVDYVQIRKFLIDFETVETTKIDDEYAEYIPEIKLELSTNTIQNILYRTAKEIIGDKFNMSQNNNYSINNTEEDLKRFFSPEHKNEYGIYFRKDGALNINGDMDPTTFEDRKNPSNLIKIRKEIELQMTEHNGDAINIGSGDKFINKELKGKYLRIFDEEIAYYKNSKNNQKKILENIKKQSLGKWIYPTISDQILALRSGIPDLGNYLYKWNGYKMERKSKDNKTKTKPQILFMQNSILDVGNVFSKF